MDLETENRIASLLMEEARRMRAQADKEGVQVYLQKPNTRGRPNSRFLTATVLGVQHDSFGRKMTEEAVEDEIDEMSEILVALFQYSKLHVEWWHTIARVLHAPPDIERWNHASNSSKMRLREEWEHRIFGPEKPSFMKSQEPTGNSGDNDSESSRKHRSKERSSKRLSSHKSKKKEKCSKHRHKSRRQK